MLNDKTFLLVPPYDRADQRALRDFNERVAALSRAISAADAHRGRLNDMLPYLEAAVMSALPAPPAPPTPGAPVGAMTGRPAG